MALDIGRLPNELIVASLCAGPCVDDTATRLRGLAESSLTRWPSDLLGCLCGFLRDKGLEKSG